jgi:hypothetical protein
VDDEQVEDADDAPVAKEINASAISPLKLLFPAGNSITR